MSYRWLEHTSELELHIVAATEAAVFETAAAALAELADDDGGSEAPPPAESTRHAARETLVREITVAAGDRAALLASFLEELVYLLETEDLLPERVDHLQLADDRLTATVRGHRGTPRHLVKGVTYNELTFARSGDGFTATVVLDV